MPTDLPHLEAIRRGAHLGLAACFGAPVVLAAPGTGQAPEVSVLVGFAGPVSGQLRLAMPRTVALACARRMAGCELADLDDAGLAALLEAATLVGGAVANELAREGVLVQLAAPTLGRGSGWAHEEALAVPAGSVSLGIGVATVGATWLVDGWLTARVPGA